jgi:hypothetical protein
MLSVGCGAIAKSGYSCIASLSASLIFCESRHSLRPAAMLRFPVLQTAQ